ncbi:MAG TPA: DNA-binding domain-containing protein [Gammaproteobacteria bacterium]|jgi:hypothetical protein
MLPLPELQQQLGQALRGGTAAGLPLRDRGISGVRRLQVYRNNHAAALREALRAVYPVTQRLVGEEFFAAAADGYASVTPSHSGNIQDYGAAFPAFLSTYPPAASLAYLGDVASLEWRRLQTAVAPPHTPMDRKALAEVPADRLTELHFHPQPGAHTFASPYPILSIWEFCQQAEPEATLDLDRGGERVLFFRTGLDVQMRRICAAEHVFLLEICRGADFAGACRAGLATEPGFDVQACFAAAVQDEILTDFYL